MMGWGLCLQVDATDFSEIATTCTEGRCVLDLCVDAADSFIGIVSVEPNELMSSSARVYEVGRQRIQVSTPAHDFEHAAESQWRVGMPCEVQLKIPYQGKLAGRDAVPLCWFLPSLLLCERVMPLVAWGLKLHMDSLCTTPAMLSQCCGVPCLQSEACV